MFKDFMYFKNNENKKNKQTNRKRDFQVEWRNKLYILYILHTM